MGLIRLLLVIILFYIIFRAFLKIGKIFTDDIKSNNNTTKSNKNKKGRITIIKGKEKKKIIPDDFGEYVDYEEL